ncbi:MAG: DNA primase, partial [Pisciglobus halotolerans]|nr:DNA primase [Pisciglobus halotolerans]
MAVRIPEDTVNDIRQKTNIADVVSQYVQLKKSGKNLFGHCPFHDDRTPSFSVTEEKQIYHCFSCGRGGNVFSFLMEIDGLSFPEAVIKTAELSDIPIDQNLIPSQSGTSGSADSKTAALLQIHQASAELFQHILLNTKVGEAALDYLLQRGLTKKTIETFGIGFAPNERIVLTQYLKGKDYSNEQLKESGLVITKDNGEQLDRFYNRIIFPIENKRGKVVAFSGRLFVKSQDENRFEPKYLNSPETHLFNKRTILFNYHRARATIRKTEEVILFEGFLDVISAYQAGVTNAVASMGTSLTNEQIQLFNKVTDKVILAYDGDDAGIEAAKKAAETLKEETHFDIEVIPFDEGLDPDDYIKTKGDASFRELVTHGRETLFSFIMQYYRRNINLSNESERLNYLDTILEKMLAVPSAIEREHYFKQISDEFSISLNSLEEQFQQIFQIHKKKTKELPQTVERSTFTKERSFVKVENSPKKLSPLERTEQLLLNRLIHFEEARIEVDRLTSEFHFVHEDYQMLYILFESFLEQTAYEGTV